MNNMPTLEEIETLMTEARALLKASDTRIEKIMAEFDAGLSDLKSISFATF